MSTLLPLIVAVPLLAAAVIVGADHVVPDRVKDVLGIAAAGAATALSLVVMVSAQRAEQLHWFGGWEPRSGVAIGISFVADPLGAAMAALACGLATLTLAYSFTYMREAARLFDALTLVFCGAMAAFALTGDLFNLFVWLELMGVAAYALAGFKVEELGPIQGAINFAVSNTFGAYLIVLGIGLLYARTGALNLAQIGHTLAGREPDGLVVVAFTLLVVGFLVKAAIVPFHFWLADAHAVAPAPICVLYSGAMVQLGLLAVARVYWIVFDPTFGDDRGDVRMAFVAFGVVTALVGAVMAFLQRHLKRMLAYSTISHSGTMLVGIGLLNTKGLAGTADLVLAHGLLKGGLFLLCGILLVQLRDVDELRLHRAGRELRTTATLWFAGSVGLIGLPYVGTFLGHALVDDGSTVGGLGWVSPLLAVASGVAAAAMLRAGARVFFGWGPRSDPLLSPEPRETPTERKATVPLMATLAAIAIVGGLVVSVVPGLQQRSELDAGRFRDRAAYVGHVLHAKAPPAAPRPTFELERATSASVAYGALALAIAFAVAALGLWRGRLPVLVRAVAARVVVPPLGVLRSAHSGVVGDYLLWIVIGTGALGGAWALVLR